MNLCRRVALAGLIGIAAQSLAAQQLRGTVRDSATGQLVAGAIVSVLDSTGVSLFRNLSSETGEYALPLPPAARVLRVQRLGFRPRELRIPNAAIGRLDVALLAIPTFLQTVNVTATACSPRADRGSALALYEQARTGLLATVVAREAKPARMVLYRYERTMRGTTDRVESQSVWVDSAPFASVSFRAAQSAKDFARTGFLQEAPGGRLFLAPDADVLLDDAFAASYCFSLAKPDRERPTQVGLAFEAAARRRDRVDIDGALWIDTVARALTDIEFGYVGLGRQVEMHRPGGRIAFREMPNGAVLIERWSLRLIGAHIDTVPGGKDRTTLLSKAYAQEIGGELARARWADGKAWRASLGRLRLRATDAKGAPAVGADLWLAESSYRGKTDSSGTIELADLVPGPYSVVVMDPALATVNVTIPTDVRFTAERDSTYDATLRVRTASDFIYERCVSDGKASRQDSTRLLVRLMTYSDDPIGGVKFKVSKRFGASTVAGSPQLVKTPAPLGGHEGLKAASTASSGSWKVLRDGGETGTDGMFQLCTDALVRGTRLGIQAWGEGWRDLNVEQTLAGAVTVIKLVLTPDP